VALDQLGKPLGELSYGAGLARYLKAKGILVMEVERPKRRNLRRNGKSDPKDAEGAARAVLAGEVAGVPKRAGGRVEMIRTLRSSRRSLKAMLLTAPEDLRQRLRGLSTKELVEVAARLRPGANLFRLRKGHQVVLSG
jgi:transposase